VLTITVSYRTAPLVMESLTRLAEERRREQKLDIRMLVIDNASSDAAPLREGIAANGWGDWVTVLESDKNGGFAYGNNLGFRFAWDQKNVPDYFFLLNPDAEVRPGALGALVDFFEEHPTAGIAGSSLEGPEGDLWPFAFRFPSFFSELESAFGWGPISKLLAKHTTRREMGEEPAEVDWFPGASMMIRREVIEELGGMDESYFLYYEETDYLRRVEQAGWSAWYVPASRVMHDAGRSTGVTGTRTTVKSRLPDYWFESRRRYFSKNHGVLYAAATDVAFLAAYGLGRLKRAVQGRSDQNVPHIMSDLLRHSVIWKRNRALAEPREYHPRKR
jgi:GT2 family glycosyltransferase